MSRHIADVVGGISQIVGRDEELAAIDEFLATASVGLPTAMVLQGRPGMGKSILFEQAVGAAGSRGMRRLVARPAEAEARLPYAGLGDLFEGTSNEELSALPPMLGGALRAALLRDVEGATPEPHAVARALQALLRNASAEQPVLLAVDDAQWLDLPSGHALEFAARRLSGTGVSMLLSRRTGEGDSLVRAIERALPADRFHAHDVGPISIDDLDALLASRLGLHLRRPALFEIHRLSEGNPLFALEMARWRADRPDGARPAQGPVGLDTLLNHRLTALSADARRVVLLTAAAAQPSAAMFTDAVSAEAVTQCVDAGVLQRGGDRLRFVHPLFATAAYGNASEAERLEAHAALASLVSDEDEAALHLARATAGPSADHADGAEAAAERAARRGSPDTAARLAEHAARLTPSDRPADARRRLGRAADYHLAAGDPGRARQLLEQLVEGAGAGPERADFLWRLADAVGDDLPLSIALSEQALEEAGDRDDLKASIHLGLATFTWLAGDLHTATGHSRRAAELAESAGDEQLAAYALGDVAHGATVLGLPLDDHDIARALAIEASAADFPSLARPSFQLAIAYLYTDRLDEARPLIEAELRRVEASGDESARVAVLFRLAELEVRAGNWQRALRCASESRTLAVQAGIEQEQSVALNGFAMVCALVGRSAEAVAAAGQALAIAEAAGDRMSVIRARGALGFVHLSQGDPAEAHRWLEPAMADIRSLGIGELSIYGVVENELEALVAVGDVAAAEDVVVLVEQKGRPTGRAWHGAIAARGSALIAGARGDHERADASIARALSEHERLPQPFQLARTLLLKGLLERRQKRRGEARATLARALEMFDTLGAPLWAEKAGAELARLGGRPPSDGSLTLTERRVAELIADGHTNAEAAARLFVTVRTIEAHLSRIYAKVGVRSRAELARRFGERPD